MTCFKIINFIVHLDRIQDVFKKLETIDEMTPAQRMSLKAELDNIVGEDFNNFSVSMIDNMMMHISSNQQMQRVFDSFSESSKPDSPIIFNKPTSNESASLILDITQGVGIGIRQDDSVVANVPTTEIDLTTVEGNIEILRKNNLIVQSPFAGSIPTFKYIFKYTYSVPGRVPGEFYDVTKIFKLNKIYSPLSEGEKGSRNNLFNVLDSTQLQGYRAEYIDVTGQQVGSVEQFAGGGLIGPVPLSTEIEQDATAERSTDKDKAKDSKGTKPQGNYENAMSYVKATEDGVEVTTVNGNTHNSNETDLNKAMDQEGEVGRGGSVLDLEAMVGKEEELPSEEEAVDMVAEMEDTEDTINEAEAAFAETYDTEAGQLEINFGDEVGASSKKMAKIMELWNSLSSEQQQEISKHYSITKFNEAWIKKNFGDMLVDKKPEEIIERLKKCS